MCICRGWGEGGVWYMLGIFMCDPLRLQSDLHTSKASEMWDGREQESWSGMSGATDTCVRWGNILLPYVVQTNN